LSGADLSRLDLSGVMLNGVWCSRFYPGGYLAASFDGARVRERNLFFWGHTSVVTSAVYRSDGKKILSDSLDQTIKEWDAATGECLQTWKKGEKPVPAEYAPRENEDIKLETNGNKIKFKGKELVNIPGLFIHGCSFKDLEPGSRISRENLEILKQYGGRFM
jgi:WD40 repeat protein